MRVGVSVTVGTTVCVTVFEGGTVGVRVLVKVKFGVRVGVNVRVGTTVCVRVLVGVVVGVCVLVGVVPEPAVIVAESMMAPVSVMASTCSELGETLIRIYSYEACRKALQDGWLMVNWFNPLPPPPETM